MARIVFQRTHEGWRPKGWNKICDLKMYLPRQRKLTTDSYCAELPPCPRIAFKEVPGNLLKASINHSS
jgi:hypothetical protein